MLCTNNILQQKTLEVKTSLGFKVISMSEILYIEAEKKCSIVYLKGNNSIITYHPLKWFDRYLLRPHFFRCHKSYIVNCRFIDYYNHKAILLSSKKMIPVSRKLNSAFKENLKKFKEEYSSE
jgi:DNA-binding LytR/AlgR family response regulator